MAIQVRPHAFPAPPSPPSQTGRLMSMLAPVGCLGLLAIILAPPFALRQHGSRNAACISNHKQVAMALLLYSEDADGRFPPVRDWAGRVFLYSKNWNIFQCMEVARTHDAPKGGILDSYGIALDSAVAGKRRLNLHEPDRMPLIYDSEMLYKGTALPIRIGIARPGRHHVGNPVSFVDGHTKWISDARIGELTAVASDTVHKSP